MKKLLCLILISSFLLCLYACKGEVTDTEVTEEESYVPVDISDVVSPFSINGEKVPYALFRYYYGLVKYRYDQDDESYWDSHDYTEEIRNEVLRYIRRAYAMEECAEQYNVSLSVADKKQVEQSILSQRLSAYADDNDYFRSLDEMYLTEEINRQVEEQAVLNDKLLEYLTSTDSGPKISSSPELVKRYIDNYVIRTDHILILNDPGDDRNENETLIKEIDEKLKNGADFEELRKKYSEDEQTNQTDTGYYIAEGDISQILSDAAFALGEGQISGVIEAPYGYHIVKRYAKDEDYIKNNLNGVFLSFYQEHIFEQMLKKLMDKQTVEFDQSFYTYTPLNIK